MFTRDEMNKAYKSVAVAAVLLPLAACGPQAGPSALGTVPVDERPVGTGPVREGFNEGWTFSLDGSEPKAVVLPHDWGVEGAFDQALPGETGKLRWWGHGEYTKTLTVAPEDGGKLFNLDFGGVMSGAKVFCNGEPVCQWPYGYSSFRAALRNVRPGDNEIKVIVDNPEESSRWYPGGGIYRNVYLVKSDPVGVAYNGTAVNVKLTGLGGNGGAVKYCDAQVTLDITLRNDTPDPRTAEIRTEVYPLDGGSAMSGKAVRSIKACAPVAETADKEVEMVSGKVFSQTLDMPGAALWSPDSPQMYAAVITVVSGTFREVYTTCFGVRTAQFNPDGFYLNGEKTFLKGVCLHHDAGALGAEWNTRAWVRRLLMLKDMGCNAIRTAHNPPAPEFLDLCDRLGLLVIDELTDTWTVPKKPNGYAVLFEDWAEKDLTAMILRDRNHPSVILWSIGNEVGEQGYADKWHIARELTELCHSLDPSRQTSAGCDNLWASTQPWHETVDVYGFNYKPHAYETFRDANPTQPFYGSETASCISTRGYYRFPVSRDKAQGWEEGAPYQVSSYDLYAPYWASCPDYEWKYEDQVPECAGEFVWTGFDYLGEPTPYNADLTVLTNAQTEEERAAARRQLEEISAVSPPSRSSYFGIFDLAGFAKDRFWLYLCRWRPSLDVTHIVPHWTWPGREGEVTPIHVYTTGDSAELFVNGESKGLKEKSPGEYRICWDDVVYEAGEVKVQPYRRGEKLREATVRTCGPVARIEMALEQGGGPAEGFGGVPVPYRVFDGWDWRPCADGNEGKELFFVDVRLTDKSGEGPVPGACNRLRLGISGPGEIIGLDAGDPTCHTPFRSTQIDAFGGLCSVLVRPTGSGTIVLKAACEGLKDASIKIKVK